MVYSEFWEIFKTSTPQNTCERYPLEHNNLRKNKCKVASNVLGNNNL